MLQRSLVAWFVLLVGLGWWISFAAAADIPSPDLKERKVIELDEPFAAVATGGGGRYFVFHLKMAKKLALLDISESKIIKTIDVPADDVVLTAGLDKLIVVTPSKGLIHRYELATLKRERSIPFTLPAPKHLLLGSSSPGPLLVWCERGPVQLWDLQSLKPLAVKGKLMDGDPMYSFQVTVSGDGQTFCGWTGGISGQQFGVMRYQDGAVTTQQTREGFSDNGRWLRPTYDGTLLFQNGQQIYPTTMQSVTPDHLKGHVLLPSEDPRYFLAVRENSQDKKAQAWICTVSGLEKMIPVNDIGHVNEGIIGSDHGHIRMQPRVRYIPAAHVMVSIPAGEKTIVLSPANLPEMLKQRGGEYLYVVSNPPRSAKVGEAWEYRLETLHSKGKVSYKLEAAPTGAKISGDGKITWTPKQRPEGGEEKFVVVAKHQESESFHSFSVAIPKAEPKKSDKESREEKEK